MKGLGRWGLGAVVVPIALVATGCGQKPSAATGRPPVVSASGAESPPIPASVLPEVRRIVEAQRRNPPVHDPNRLDSGSAMARMTDGKFNAQDRKHLLSVVRMGVPMDRLYAMMAMESGIEHKVFTKEEVLAEIREQANLAEPPYCAMYALVAKSALRAPNEALVRIVGVTASQHLGKAPKDGLSTLEKEVVVDLITHQDPKHRISAADIFL